MAWEEYFGVPSPSQTGAQAFQEAGTMAAPDWLLKANLTSPSPTAGIEAIDIDSMGLPKRLTKQLMDRRRQAVEEYSRPRTEDGLVAQFSENFRRGGLAGEFDNTERKLVELMAKGDTPESREAYNAFRQIRETLEQAQAMEPVESDNFIKNALLQAAPSLPPMLRAIAVDVAPRLALALAAAFTPVPGDEVVAAGGVVGALQGLTRAAGTASRLQRGRAALQATYGATGIGRAASGALTTAATTEAFFPNFKAETSRTAIDAGVRPDIANVAGNVSGLVGGAVEGLISPAKALGLGQTGALVGGLKKAIHRRSTKAALNAIGMFGVERVTAVLGEGLEEAAQAGTTALSAYMAAQYQRDPEVVAAVLGNLSQDLAQADVLSLVGGPEVVNGFQAFAKSALAGGVEAIPAVVGMGLLGVPGSARTAMGQYGGISRLEARAKSLGIETQSPEMRGDSVETYAQNLSGAIQVRDRELQAERQQIEAQEREQEAEFARQAGERADEEQAEVIRNARQTIVSFLAPTAEQKEEWRIDPSRRKAAKEAYDETLAALKEASPETNWVEEIKRIVAVAKNKEANSKSLSAQLGGMASGLQGVGGGEVAQVAASTDPFGSPVKGREGPLSVLGRRPAVTTQPVEAEGREGAVLEAVEAREAPVVEAAPALTPEQEAQAQRERMEARIGAKRQMERFERRRAGAVERPPAQPGAARARPQPIKGFEALDPAQFRQEAQAEVDAATDGKGVTAQRTELTKIGTEAGVAPAKLKGDLRKVKAAVVEKVAENKAQAAAPVGAPVPRQPVAPDPTAVDRIVAKYNAIPARQTAKRRNELAWWKRQAADSLSEQERSDARAAVDRIEGRTASAVAAIQTPVGETQAALPPPGEQQAAGSRGTITGSNEQSGSEMPVRAEAQAKPPELMTPDEYQDGRRAEAYRGAKAEWDKRPKLTLSGLMKDAGGAGVPVFKSVSDRKPVGFIPGYIKRGEDRFSVSQYGVEAHQHVNDSKMTFLGWQHKGPRFNGKKLTLDDAKAAVKWINDADKPLPDRDYYDSEGAMDDHIAAISEAIKQRKPISAVAYDETSIGFYVEPKGHKEGNPPSGYVREGDRYVFKPQPAGAVQPPEQTVDKSVGAVVESTRNSTTSRGVTRDRKSAEGLNPSGAFSLSGDQPAKSRGHVGFYAFDGVTYELYKDGKGELYRAQLTDVMDVRSGMRIGRWEAPAHQADKRASELLAAPAAPNAGAEAVTSQRLTKDQIAARFLEDEIIVERNDPRWEQGTDRTVGPGASARFIQQRSLADITTSPSVFHETSLNGARNILARIESGSRRHTDIWVAESADLALGQSGKGYVIELDSTAVNGFKAKTLANETLAAIGAQGSQAYLVDKSVKGAVLSITAPNAKGLAALARDPLLAKRFDFTNPVQTERGLKAVRVSTETSQNGRPPVGDTPASTEAEGPTRADLVRERDALKAAVRQGTRGAAEKLAEVERKLAELDGTRFQTHSLTNDKPATRENVGTFFRDLAQRIGASWTGARVQSGDIGTLRVGSIVVRVTTGQVAKEGGMAQVQRGVAGDYTITIDPANGRVTSAPHEVGHILFDSMTPTQKQMATRALGFDVTERGPDGQLFGEERFVEMLETEDGRANVAQRIVEANPAEGTMLVRFLNRLIDAWNGLFGTQIGRIASRESKELARGLRDMSLVWQQSRGEAMQTREMTGFHGTPHTLAPEPGFKHGRFRMDKIGTGEGAQAYGHGIYFAEAVGVAKAYHQGTTDPIRLASNIVNDAGISDISFDDVREIIRHGRLVRIKEMTPRQAALSITARSMQLSKHGMDKIQQAVERFSLEETSGSVYRLDIPDDVIPKLLDWDKPLSEQPEAVRKALGNDTVRRAVARYRRGGSSVETAQDVYHALSWYLGDKPDAGRVIGLGADGSQILDRGAPNDKAASDFLAGIGIPGLRYLDGQSRADGEGSRNTVIWDQPTLDRIALLERNGNALDDIRSERAQESGLAGMEQTAPAVTPEQDAEYLRLAEDPEANRKALQAMVDEAAKAAGYTTIGYHGTWAKPFTKFKASEVGQGIGGYKPRMKGGEFYFGRDEARAKEASEYGADPPNFPARVMRVWLRNPDTSRLDELIIPANRPQDIKSADPVTRDNQGRVIPLSKRFDPQTPDIRFQSAEGDIGAEAPTVAAEPRLTHEQALDALRERGITNPHRRWLEAGKPMAFTAWVKEQAKGPKVAANDAIDLVKEAVGPVDPSGRRTNVVKEAGRHFMDNFANAPMTAVKMMGKKIGDRMEQEAYEAGTKAAGILKRARNYWRGADFRAAANRARLMDNETVKDTGGRTVNMSRGQRAYMYSMARQARLAEVVPILRQGENAYMRWLDGVERAEGKETRRMLRQLHYGLFYRDGKFDPTFAQDWKIERQGVLSRIVEPRFQFTAADLLKLANSTDADIRAFVEASDAYWNDVGRDALDLADVMAGREVTPRDQPHPKAFRFYVPQQRLYRDGQTKDDAGVIDIMARRAHRLGMDLDMDVEGRNTTTKDRQFSKSGFVVAGLQDVMARFAEDSAKFAGYGAFQQRWREALDQNEIGITQRFGKSYYDNMREAIAKLAGPTEVANWFEEMFNASLGRLAKVVLMTPRVWLYQVTGYAAYAPYFGLGNIHRAIPISMTAEGRRISSLIRNSAKGAQIWMRENDAAIERTYMDESMYGNVFAAETGIRPSGKVGAARAALQHVANWGVKRMSEFDAAATSIGSIAAFYHLQQMNPGKTEAELVEMAAEAMSKAILTTQPSVNPLYMIRARRSSSTILKVLAFLSGGTSAIYNQSRLALHEFTKNPRDAEVRKMFANTMAGAFIQAAIIAGLRTILSAKPKGDDDREKELRNARNFSYNLVESIVSLLPAGQTWSAESMHALAVLMDHPDQRRKFGFLADRRTMDAPFKWLDLSSRALTQATSAQTDRTLTEAQKRIRMESSKRLAKQAARELADFGLGINVFGNERLIRGLLERYEITEPSPR
jgi:hypothetical protein